MIKKNKVGADSRLSGLVVGPATSQLCVLLSKCVHPLSLSSLRKSSWLMSTLRGEALPRLLGLF